jgi:uncharacterized membrane protein
MSSQTQTPGNTVYNIVLFSFAGAKRAGDVLQDIDQAQKLAGSRIIAEAWVERDLRGNVHVHEAGRGGRGGTAGAVAGGVLGLLGGPLAVPLLAIAGGVFGGVAGHLAGRAIPTEDLKRLGNALPPDSSGLVVLAEDTEAEKVIEGMKDYRADVVTVVVGDELSGEIDAAVYADVVAAPGGQAGAAAGAQTASATASTGAGTPAAPATGAASSQPGQSGAPPAAPATGSGTPSA